MKCSKTSSVFFFFSDACLWPAVPVHSCGELRTEIRKIKNAFGNAAEERQACPCPRGLQAYNHSDKSNPGWEQSPESKLWVSQSPITTYRTTATTGSQKVGHKMVNMWVFTFPGLRKRTCSLTSTIFILWCRMQDVGRAAWILHDYQQRRPHQHLFVAPLLLGCFFLSWRRGHWDSFQNLFIVADILHYVVSKIPELWVISQRSHVWSQRQE